VNTQDNVFSDPGDGGGGYADKAMALADTNINYDDPSDRLDGDKWGKAVQSLRDMGYDIPHYIPDVGSKKRNDEGAYEQTPNWAMKQAALLFGVCSEDDFVEEQADDGTTFTRLSSAHYAETVEILQGSYGYTVIEDDKPETSNGNTSKKDSDVGASSTDNTGDIADMEAILGEPTGDESNANTNPDDTQDGQSMLSSQSNNPFVSSVEIPTTVDNPDKYALKKFVEQHCELHPDDDSIKIPRSRVMQAFVNWADHHNIEEDLNKLSPDTFINTRKGKLKK
jgi:hypothetical protein